MWALHQRRAKYLQKIITETIANILYCYASIYIKILFDNTTQSSSLSSGMQTLQARNAFKMKRMIGYLEAGNYRLKRIHVKLSQEKSAISNRLISKIWQIKQKTIQMDKSTSSKRKNVFFCVRVFPFMVDCPFNICCVRAKIDTVAAHLNSGFIRSCAHQAVIAEFQSLVVLFQI